MSKTTRIKSITIVLIVTLIGFTSCNDNKADSEKDTVESQKDANDSTFETNSAQNSPQEFNLYVLKDLENNSGKKVGFVSLSDKYMLSEHQDSLAIPRLENIRNKKKLRYLILNQEYRIRFLSKMGIAETDSLFMYDYAMNKLLSFPIKDLNVCANLSVYSNITEHPKTQYDYEIGFEIDKKSHWKSGEYYNALVFVGKENPFMQGQMQLITWKKINSNEFPIKKSNLKNSIPDSLIANSYLYVSDKYKYFINDFREPRNNHYIAHRHFMVIDKNTENVIIERLFRESEGTSLVPLFTRKSYTDYNELEQWTGKLFKDKPEVIFGFEYFSFGCPNIIFINPNEKDIYINCDNRH